ncbi:hypothetical protein HDV00_006950 [Rhizophlyctis rosea]|nr:hypothetical protein HDV00_006950 [Rhizophlyctis rosea]
MDFRAASPYRSEDLRVPIGRPDPLLEGLRDMSFFDNNLKTARSPEAETKHAAFNEESDNDERRFQRRQHRSASSSPARDDSAAMHGEVRRQWERIHEMDIRRYEDKIRTLEAKQRESDMQTGALKSRAEVLQQQRDAAVADRTQILERLKSQESHICPPPVDIGMTKEDWKEMNDRMDLLIQENDALVEQNKKERREIAKLRSELTAQGKEVHTTKQTLTETLDQLHATEEGVRSLQEANSQLEKECKTWQNELEAASQEIQANYAEKRRIVNELHAAEAQVGDLRRSLEEVTGRYHAHVQDSTALATREKELMTTLKATLAELEDTKTKNTSLESELQTLKEEHSEVLKISKALEQRAAMLEEQRVELYQEGQRHIEKAEESSLEKEKALMREQQAQKEIQRLAEKLRDVAAKNRERMEGEIEVLRTRHMEDKRKHAEDMAKLEATCANLQGQIDRAIRDKRAAESELEKATRHLPTDHDRLTMTLDELNAKLRSNEREKMDAVHKMESAQQKLAREQNRFEKEKQQLAESSEHTYRRLRKVEVQLEETKEERVKLLSRIAELEHALVGEKEGRLKCVAGHEAEMGALRQRYEGQVEELTTKLQHLGEAHGKTCRDLQILLSEQRAMSERWKEESTRLTTHHTHTLSETRHQLSRSHQRCEDLESQLLRAEARRKELMAQLADDKREAGRVGARLREVEGCLEGARRQNGVLVGREREGGEEKKRLQRELDRAQLDKERLERELSLQVKQQAGKVAGLVGTATLFPDEMHEDFDRSFKEDEKDLRIRTLQQEIERVKNRSRTRKYIDVGELFDAEDDEDLDGGGDDGLSGVGEAQ